MEALTALVQQQVAAQAVMLAQLQELQRQVKVQNKGPLTPAMIEGNNINLCSDGSGSDSDTPVVPRKRRSPRLKKKTLKLAKREKKKERPLKRTLSFEDAVRARGKRKSKSPDDQRLRKSLGARLSVIDEDLLAGKFHNQKGKFDTDLFFETVAPLIKQEIGSDFEDDELPNRYTFCTHKKTCTITHKKTLPLPSARTKKHA